MSKCKIKQISIAPVRVVALLILTGMLASVFLGCSRDAIDENLLGTWQYNDYTEYVFSADGSGFLCADDVHYEYRYQTKGDTVKLDFTEDVVQDCEYTYSINEETLTLVGGEGTDQGTYQLKKAD